MKERRDMPINGVRCEQGEEEKARKGFESDLARRLFERRIIVFASEVSRRSARDVIAQLLALSEEDAGRPIRLFLNSPGGDVDAGFAIFDVIRFVQAPVDVVVTGLAASAGVVILLATPRERRFSLTNARFLIHQPSSGAHGDASDIEIEASEILKIRAAINKLICEETGQPMEKVEADTRRNYWMGAGEALQYGLVSRIIAKRDDLV